MNTLPPASVIPFIFLLLGIAAFPLAVPRWWERNRNKALFSLVLGIPVAGFLVFTVEDGPHKLFETVQEYAAFIALLASLYVISGGIYLKGSLAGTPLTNTAFLGIGAVLANVIGTTGASMVLIRPLLRANESRRDKTHLVVFFIFIVSNIGGCLTPLGDPPLFLGFLRGVPFPWTLQLWKEWAFVNGVLLALFNLLDQYRLNKEERERPGAQLEELEKVKEPLRLKGKVNLLLLFGVIAAIFGVGTFGHREGWSEETQKVLQIAGMAFLTAVSLVATPKEYRRGNAFTFHPIVEVAILFAGIFVTMIPALMILDVRGRELGLTAPWQFFWLTGSLSSFLDNAPTYVTFLTLGQGSGVIPRDLSTVEVNPFLVAISLGAVFMGANTYIGNGPNFMVKAIAEEQKVKMPSFFGYMLWSLGVLVPLFVVVTMFFL